MTQRHCARCQTSNPLQNNYCGHCGAAMERLPMVLDQKASLVKAASSLPAPPLKQVGRAVVVGVLSLAAEAGLSNLRRRLAQTSRSLTPAGQPNPATPVRTIGGYTNIGRYRMTVFGQHLVETRESNRLTHRSLEHFVWHIFERPE